MTTSGNSNKGERTSTYMVQDSKKEAELRRQVLQGHMITAAMGGVLAEQPDQVPFVASLILLVARVAGHWIRQKPIQR